MDRIPVKTNPQMFDKVVLPIQRALASAFPWLDHAIGICEYLTSTKEKKRYNYAALYMGNGQYEQIMPCEELGNFSFFYLRDPQTFGAKDTALVKSPYSLVIWYNLMEVLPEGDERNREQIKGQIMGVLNNLHLAGFEVTRIYEKPDNVFSDFSYDHANNQFLMHPFTGLRIDGYMTVRADCFVDPHQSVGDGSFSDSLDDSTDL